jgi:hypothetical protein
MPPRIDPYSNKTHRRIDIALIVLTLVLIFFALRYSAHSRTQMGAPTQAQTSQINHQWTRINTNH